MTDADTLIGEAAFTGWEDRQARRHPPDPAGRPARAIRHQVGEQRSRQMSAMPDGAKPTCPIGFDVEMVASGFEQPRVIRTAPNGDLFVADSKANEIHVLRMEDGSAKPVENSVFASGPQPALWHRLLSRSGRTRNGSTSPTPTASSASPTRTATSRRPGKPETIVEHPAHRPPLDPRRRLLARRQQDVRLGRLRLEYRRAGERASRGGIAGIRRDTSARRDVGRGDDRADVLSFDPDGSDKQVFATGLRNCSGMTVQPANGALWCVVNERDELGDNLPSDYATAVEEGEFYGWPWYYIGNHEDPRAPLKGQRPDLADKVTRAGRAVPGPLGAAQHHLLRRRHVPGRVQGRRLRHAARLVEPRQSHRLQGRPPALRRRGQADRRVSGLHDRLRHLRRATCGAARSASPSRRTARSSSPRTARARSGASRYEASPS